MTELSLPRLHQFSLLTKKNNECRNRGNISILSIVWLGFTALAISVMAHATSLVLQRARMQASADAVALALASRNEAAAQLMASHNKVTIVSAEWLDNMVTVIVASSAETATAQALRSSYEFTAR
jgi:hypothetical protein